MKKVIIIGGGAAGMIAAISAAKNGAEVILLEKNEKLGKKIYITGKGRCNVTNDCEPDNFFENIVSNSKFMFSAYYGFDNTQVIAMLQNEGCDLKTERGNRVFPVSDHSSDIINTLHRIMKKLNISINLNSKVKKLLISNNSCYGIVLEDGKSIEADSVIVATGGLSYSSTGSTGDGIRWAQETEHRITECKPALVPFIIEEEWVKDLQGLSLKNVSLELIHDGKKIHEGFGEMMFTHFGVTGPLVLSASSYYVAYNRKNKKQDIPIKLKLDLKSALTFEQLDKRILRDFEKDNNKKFRNGLNELLPSKIIPVIIKMSGINPDKNINLITKEERQKLVSILKGLEMTVSGTRGFNEAIITQGGVHVKDVNPSTMESKIISNLYFAGEVLDVDALTGGYNLQVAWSTGHLAGESAAIR